MECVFCKIIAGEIPAEVIDHDERVFAFRDIHPVAPTHILIIPMQHIASLAELPATETSLIADMVKLANRLAKEEGIDKTGYRLVINSGKEGGQVVPHLHMHLIGGRQMKEALG
ncbi:MAG: histidine triad nucleotide-binding protein [Chloroflexota bacterium]